MVSSGRKLLDQARNCTAQWQKQKLERLYTSFGFVIKNGSKHDIVKHPDFPQLRSTLPRHNVVNRVYVAQAVSLIEKLFSLEKEFHDQEN